MLDRVPKFLSISRVILYVSIVLFFAIVPTEYIEGGPTICLFRNMIGVPCLGCGLTRAISSIFHGNFVKALSYNKLIVIIFPLLCFLCFYDLLRLSGLLSIKKTLNSPMNTIMG